MSEDRRVIACNLVKASSAASSGALAYVVRLNPGGGDDRIVILVRSRSGRWIEKWESIQHLDNFRAKTLPPEHPQYAAAIWGYDDIGGSLQRLRAAKEAKA